MSKRQILIAVIAIALAAFVAIGVANLQGKRELNQLNKTKLESREVKLKKLELEFKQLHEDYQKAKGNEKRIQELDEKNKQLQEETERLERELQAKKDKQSTMALKPSGNVASAASVPASAGCEYYLKAAGITDPLARELLRRENAGCNPNLYNMAGSDACGIAQELPCGKSGCGMPPNADGVCQMKWMQSYVNGRYGGWAGAIAWHNTHNWY